MDLNRKRNAYTKVIQAFNTIHKRGKVVFSDECAVCRSCQSANVVFWSKENLNFFQEMEHSPLRVVICAGVESKRLYGPHFFDGP